MTASHWVTVGALLGALGVIAGAFGAHALEGRLTPDEAATYEIAVRYQMYHALALVLVGLLATRSASVWLSVAGWSLLSGVVIFSGLLYVLVFTGVKILGAMVPVGGLAFVVGWVSLAWAARSLTTSRRQD